MQTIRKKTSPLKYRNEPGRFFGDGVSFKAKLIGILEVGEARGDRMCQEALQDLKMAIRAAGEHKQRITIHVTIDGLRLRDEKTGDSLYHHPVHKISFIAQDMTDSRAFGYIFGSPDSGHRFFGIKTDKAASQVVLAMRDLFQVVFELKKKEIELARQHIQSKITAHEHQAVSASLMAKTSATLDSGGAGCGGGSYGKNHPSDPLGALGGASSMLAGSSSKSGATGSGTTGTLGKSEKSPESVADLVDLEQELSCIQRGITQMERITPSEGPGKSVLDDDPFGDSFANIPPAYNLLPPPESSKRHQKQTNRSTENLPKATETSPVVVSSTPPPAAAPPVPTDTNTGSTTVGTTSSALSSHQTGGGVNAGSRATPTPLNTSQSSAQNEEWLNSPPNTSRFDPDPVRYSDEPKLAEETGKAQPTANAAQPSSYTDVFTDLDPLGTGKIKPYIDKKYFFQELKNPPKKVLKDLSGKDSTFNANFASEDQQSQSSQLPGASTLNASNISTLASGSGDLFKANFDEAQAKLSSESHGPMDHGPSSAPHSSVGSMMETSLVTSAASSKNVDLFQEDDDFSKLQLDPFEVHFSRNASPRPAPVSSSCSTQRAGPPTSDAEDTNSGGNRPVEELGEPGKAGPVYNGPLQVNLPPESWASYISQKRLERQTSEANAAQSAVCGGPMARNRPAASSVFKQNTVDVISSLSSSSKKMKPNLFGQKFSKRDSNSINMRRLQESDSLSETETAPEPPPRPDSASHIEPPPLPPKKQFADIVIRPSPRASFGSDRGSGGTGQRYDYVGAKYETTSRSSPQSTGGPTSDAPPLPLPSRKVGRSAGETVGPGRPQKKSNDEEDYLTPIAGKPDIPTLLPPPQRKDGSKTSRSTTRKQSETDPRNLDEPTPPPTSKSPLGGSFARDLPTSSFLPDITLSQLLTLGIDELAAKLNVPVSKLSTMTLVELTTYLSEFIENSKQPAMVAPKPSQDTGSGHEGSVSESPVFKVNFDDANEFVAKFDDNFGEDDRRDRSAVGPPSFVANFDDLNLQHPAGGRVSAAGGFGTTTTPATCSSSVVDKYAVFREIIEQDTGAGDEVTPDESVDREQEQHARLDLQHEVASEMSRLSPAFGAGEGSSPSPSGGQLSNSFTTAATGTATSPLTQLPMTKIDTKITEVISHAKDRYAALRDIILVEDLFEKPAPIARMESSSFEDRELELDDSKFEANFDDMIGGNVGTGGSPEINISDAEPNGAGTPDQATTLSGVSLLRTTNATPREDLEIDELMQQAVSNLSLHGTDQQLSPAPTAGSRTQPQGLAVKGSPLLVSHSSTSPYRPPTSTSTTLLNDMIAPKSKSPTYAADTLNLVATGKGGVIDTSTSPIPLGQKQQQQLGMARSPILKPSSHGPLRVGDEVMKGMKKKPTPAPRGQSTSEKRSSGSMSDGDDETSPEGGDNNEGGKMSRNTPTNATESWAVFDHPEPPMGQHSSKHRHADHRHETRNELTRRGGDKNGPESPCSSDAKDEWTKAADLREYGRRWPTKGHTSSSSRDVSPWDEEGPDYRKRPMHGGSSTADMRHHHATSGERYHHPRMPPRRINSNDEEYEDEPMKDQRSGAGGRRRGMKGGAGSRSRDNFEDEHWYHDGGHHPTWASPTDDDDSRQATGGGGGERGSRSFDRNAYERSTYGPPYEKREPKSLPPYDRREYKSYDKRKYYREREPSRGSGSGGRSSYDYDPYGGDGYGRRSDYDDGYERPGCRDSREAREYFYERDRKSFDRESNESYDSRERRSFGSGDLYGSLDSRAEYRERERDRDRYLSLEKSRSLRRGMRNAGSARLDQELDQDSEGDLIGGTMGRSSAGGGGGGGGLRGPDGGVNSLHRSSQNIGGRAGKHQQHHQQMLLDDDVWGVAKGAAPWKRPSSATEQERRYEGVRQRSGGPGHGGAASSNLAGSDGEKDRRFRKKSRSRAGERKEQELRSSNYATMRYPLRSKEDYFDFDAVEGGRRGSVGAGVGALDDDDDDEDDEGGGGKGGMLMLDDPLDDSPAYYGRRQPAGGGGAGVPYYGKPSTTPRQEGRLVSDALIAQEAKKMSRYEYEEEALRRMKKSNSRDLYFDGSESKYGAGGGGGGGGGYGTVTPPKSASGKHHHGGRMDFEFDEFGDPLPGSGGGGKFSSNYDPPGGDGFESDFNSPPTMGTAAGAPSVGSLMMHGGSGQKSYRFSNDFSGDKERAHYGHEPAGQGYHHHHRQQQQQQQQQGSHSSHHYKSHSASGYPDPATEYSHSHHSQSSTTSPPPAPPSAPSSGSKLRFNENVTVSKFDAEATTMFEDDFAGRSDTEQDLVEQQQQQHGWPSATSPGPLVASPAAVTHPTAPASINNGSNKKILKTSSHPSAHHQHSQQQQQQQHQQDNIRKSDSINIFAKKVDDPFEDDDFFSSQGGGGGRDPFGGGGGGPPAGSGGSNDPSAVVPGGTGGWDKNFANFDDNI